MREEPGRIRPHEQTNPSESPGKSDPPPGFPPIPEELIALLLGPCEQQKQEEPPNPFLAPGQAVSYPKTADQMSAAQLAELAGIYPQLRHRILSHPNCNERLRRWIQREDPAAYETWVKERQAAQALEEAARARQFQRDRENQAAVAAAQAAQIAHKKRSMAKARLRNRVLKPVGIALGLLAVSALAFYITYLVALEQAAVPVTAADPSEASAQPLATPTPSLDEDDWVRPVDFHASQQSLVSSPDGRVICQLQGLQAGCSVVERAFPAAGLQDCPQAVFSLSVDEAAAALACGQDFRPAEGSYIYGLQEGEQVYWAQFACTYLGDSISCWNQRTGVGFELSPQKYRLL